MAIGQLGSGLPHRRHANGWLERKTSRLWHAWTWFAVHWSEGRLYTNCKIGSVAFMCFPEAGAGALSERNSLDCVWNVMAHAHKPDFVFRRNRRVHLNRRGRQFSRLLAAEVCASAVVMLDAPCSEVVWRVLATHSIRQFPPSLSLSCVTVCHQISTGLY